MVWYYVKKGKTHGPASSETVIELIQKGDLGPYDLVYKEGDPKWREIKEFLDFSDYIKRSEYNVKNDMWVVLQKKPQDKGKGFSQQGPFSTADVIARIKEGKVKYTDYVWKEGMREWYRIANLEIFNTPPPKVEFKKTVEPPPIPTESSENLLSKVKVLERTAPPPLQSDKVSPPPGEDLVKMFEIKKQIPRSNDVGAKVPVDAKPPPELKSEVREHTAIKIKAPTLAKTELKNHSESTTASASPPRPHHLEKIQNKKSDNKQAFAFGIVGLILFIFSLSVFLIYSFLPKNKRPEMVAQPPPPVVQPETKKLPNEFIDLPEGNAPTAQQLQQQADNKKILEDIKKNTKVPPTFMKITLNNPDEGESFLLIETDASEHFLVAIELLSGSGKILSKMNVYKQVKLKAKPEIKFFLPKKQYPEGEYQLLAEIEAIKKDIPLFVGKRDGEFKKKLEGQRKQISYFHQVEKRQLVSLSNDFKELVADLAENCVGPSAPRCSQYMAGWARRYKRFKSRWTTAFQSQSLDRFIHINQWLNMRDMVKDLDKSYQSINRKSTTAEITVGMRTLQSSANIARSRMTELSLWN